MNKRESKTEKVQAGARGGYILGTIIVLAVTLLCAGGFIGLINRDKTDSGLRVWMLNHTPDQVLIINPFDGVIEKKLLVADGLKELAFSRDYSKAYIANMVDVTNKLTVLNTQSYLVDETLEVDGIPQGIGIFPDDHKVAVITGSKTDFKGGGFDVLDLYEQSKADPTKKKRLWRVRDLALSHKIAVSDDGDKIYVIDAEDEKIFVYSLGRQELIKEVNVHGAPAEMVYPRNGDSYFVSVLVHDSIYQINKVTDEVEKVYMYAMPDGNTQFSWYRMRFFAVDNQARHIYATNNWLKTVAIWNIGDPKTETSYEDVPIDLEDGRRYKFELPYYFPTHIFKLKGGYDENFGFIPGGMQITLDPNDEYLCVVDDEGALYIFDTKSIREVEWGGTPEPRKIIVPGLEAEIRDVKVCQPPYHGTVDQRQFNSD